MDQLARAREAYRRGAWADAYDAFSAVDAQGGLEAGDQGGLAAGDLDRLGTAAYLVGRDDASVAAWERAHRAYVQRGEVAAAARGAFWLGLTLFQRGEPARGGGWLARARRLLDGSDLDCAERGYLLLPAALQALAGGDPAAAYAGFEAAAAAGDRFGDPDLTTLARLGCGQALVAQGDVPRGAALLDEAMVAVTAGEVSPIVAGIAYCGAIRSCREAFDLQRAREWTDGLSRWWLAQQGLKPFAGQCLVHRSEILQVRGEWTDAMTEVRRAAEHLAGRPGDPAVGMAHYQQGELLRLRGEFGAAEEAYRQAGTFGHPVQPGLALLRLAQRRAGEAEAAIRRAVAEAEGRVARSRLLPAYVEILLATGDLAAATAAADELAEIAAAFGSPYLQAMADTARGAVLVAAGDPAAGGALRRAWTRWCELAAPYEAARLRVLIGRACAASGDASSAALEWDGARDAFQRLGAAPDLATVDSLRSSGVSGVLTGREREVLALAAAGKTNREIGAALAISEHTVRRHLQNIFHKLDVPSRAAATAYAYRNNLI